MNSLVFTVVVGFALQAAVSGRSQNNPKSGEFSLQRNSAGNVMLQKQKHRERQTIMILEERKVSYYGGDQKSRIKRNIELYEESGSGEIFTTLIPSPDTTRTPEGSGDGFTTPEGSGDISTSTVEPMSTTTNPTPPIQCQNGGSVNGNTCICVAHFFGDHCEFISGRIELGAKINVTVKVELEFVNRNFHENLQDISSEEYRNFETSFKNEMAMVYGGIPGYKDVEILAMRRGSIIVNHIVILDVEYIYPVDLNVTYNTVFKNVKAQLEILKNRNCTSGISSLCIDETTFKMEANPVPTMEELCRNAIPDNFANFFTPQLTRSGVICLSDCEKESSNHQDCNDGICLILPKAGARCSCPNTDQYIYTSGNCGDKMSKSALYGGLGAAIGVLTISLLIMGIFQFKQWRRNKRDANKDDWYSDTDDIWKNEYSIIKFNDNRSDQQDGDSSNRSVVETFSPVLETIDPSIEVKTKRPSIFRI